MTDLVNHESGEKIASLTPDEARGLTERIRSGLNELWPLVLRAFQEDAWKALGYASWNDYCTAEFKGVKLALPRDERRLVIESMRDAGMSQREIAAGTGLGRSTVNRELGVPNGTPEPQIADDDSDGTPDAVDAVSSPTEEVGAVVEPAPTSPVSVEGVTGEPLPSRTQPVTPSVEDPLRQFVDDDAEWQATFATRLSQLSRFVAYSSATIRERATAEQIADAIELGRSVAARIAELETNHRTLKVINGGQQ